MPFSASVETNEAGHPLRIKLTVVELSSQRNRRLGAAPPRHRYSGRLRWLGLLSWRSRGGLRSWASGGGRLESLGRAPQVSLGEHDSRQHQERLALDLPCDSTQVSTTPSLGVRLPFQSSHWTAWHHLQTYLCGA